MGGRYRRLGIATAVVVAVSLIATTGTALAGGLGADQTLAAPVEPTVAPSASTDQTNAQRASQEQAAAARAEAVDPQPTNVFISVRINSPGDNGPVTQTSTTTVAGAAENAAATNQDARQASSVARPVDLEDSASQAGQINGQDAGIEQAAAAEATATEPRPMNVVVSVRVNSPGGDAPVTQGSAVVVGAAAKNAAATAQRAEQVQVAPDGPSPPSADSAAPHATPHEAHASPASPASSPAPSPGTARAPAPPTCVQIRGAPGAPRAAVRVVITVGRSCKPATRSRPANSRAAKIQPRQAPPVLERAPVAAPAAAAPIASRASPVAVPKKRSAPPTDPAPRGRQAQADESGAKASRFFELPSSSPKPLAAGLVAVSASATKHEGGLTNLVRLVLLLGALAAAALWSWRPLLLERLPQGPNRPT
ncbi:MAG TPA: hypothetical protein VF101_16035 [Gaiellaceae bacterium]